MDGATLQDKIARGMGVAARAVGVLCDAYRPSGTTLPLESGNRFLELSAAFNARDPQFRSASLPSQAMWYGVFDSAYLLPGDYLLETLSGRVWFVAAVQNLLPAVCVLTNRVVQVNRAASVAVAGINAYGGGTQALPVIAGFPASLLHSGTSRGNDAIPADVRLGGAIGLLPPVANVTFARGDMLADDLGRNYAVGQAELNEFGWTLELRQAAS